jgi:Anti-sigma factor NepR
MPEKTPERSQKKENKASAPGLASPDAAPVAADRYIADQLKAMYETVAAEPIPDRLLQLLNRLGRDEEK